ncbi:MAG: cysteine hydrolase family protein [Streptococcus sp.]|nr:cysteine hydrolase family protein [Streptococcus sp.]
MKTALLVIDVQNGLMDANPYQSAIFLDKLKKNIRLAREYDIEIIYVRHNSQEFEKGTRAWEIVPSIAPLKTDIIIDKTYNSAFKETNLDQYLTDNKISRLILTGMLTNYCIDTTVKVAFELNYKVCVIEGGSTTFDDERIAAADLIEHYENIWADNFALVDYFENIIKEE